MKRLALILALFAAALALTACGGKDAAPAAPAATSESSDASAGSAQASAQAQPAAERTAKSAAAERPVDLDLTKISGTVVYSQVYDMIEQPNAYKGLKVKLKGDFSYYQDPDTAQEYFAAIIADATACCAQGIEFSWQGQHAFPLDYPPLGTEITVTGTFGTYYEGENMYICLTDADVSWDGQGKA